MLGGNIATTSLYIAAIGVLSFGYALSIFCKSDKSDPTTKGSITDAPPSILEEQKTTLEALSVVWATGQIRKIPINELSKIWKHQPDQITTTDTTEMPAFTHSEIKEFYTAHVLNKPFFANKQLTVIHDLLKILDSSGDCESVVNKHPQEAERSLAPNTYEMLKTIPLWRHTLNVAEEIIKLTPKGASTPKMVITALAHDLGKIPAYYDPMSTSALHGFISTQAMEWLSTLKELRYCSEVTEAVRLHHTPPDGDYLAKTLQDADAAARRNEMMSIMTAAQSKQDPPEPNHTSDAPDLIVDNQTHDVMGTPLKPNNDVLGQDSPKIKGKVIPIDWFDHEKIKLVMAAQVNKPIPGEKWWGALSMPDGYAYFKLPAYWYCIQKAFPEEATITAADEQVKNDIMLSISQYYVKHKITPNTVRKNQIGAKYILNPESEKPIELYLFPINLDQIGLDTQFCEHAKTNQLKNIKAIKPKFRRTEI